VYAAAWFNTRYPYLKSDNVGRIYRPAPDSIPNAIVIAGKPGSEGVTQRRHEEEPKPKPPQKATETVDEDRIQALLKLKKDIQRGKPYFGEGGTSTRGKRK